MSVGFAEACRAIGDIAVPVLAIDDNEDALATYAANFPTAKTICDSIESLLDGGLGSKPTISERRLLDSLPRADFVLAGPPCQGHSNLNNYTRRRDSKNLLMLRVVRFVELTTPQWVVIENVPQARLDQLGTTARTIDELRAIGYHVDDQAVDMSTIGVAQSRSRYVIVASKERHHDIGDLLAAHRCGKRSLKWAIGDLVKTRRDVFDSHSISSDTNMRRIDYLFDNSTYDLPDYMRPDCHRLKPHSYRSVYGRLKWSEPAPTITTGFGSTGQGRYVHPTRRSTITPHEAARIQFFPDSFDFSNICRTSLARMIGNAVPPKLIYALATGIMR